MYRRVTLIRGKWMLKKWCFTFDSMCIQWNDGSEFLLHIIHVVYKIIAISLKSFSKHVYQIDLCSAWENSKDVFNRSMPWLSEFKDAFIEQFTVDFLKARCLQIHYLFQKIQILAYTRIEKLSLLNWRAKIRYFEVHLPST